MSTLLQTIVLLAISNTFMTIAWYGHLKEKSQPLLIAILISWGIAFFEYIFQVPANRIGASRMTLTQLKVLQEVITLTVFIVYAFVQFREPIRWNNIVAMLFIVGAVYFTFGAGGNSQQ
jgi:uncharacterized protein (DUF486 family)